jgi:DNA helicase-2/ATP-dependent DNA helicase PcrA
MRILKQYIHHLGYRNNFTIYDGADRQDLLKQVILSQDLDVEDYDLFELGNLFSDIKTKRSVWNNGASERLKNIYAEYNKHMKAYNAVDFDDLIMMPLRLFGNIRRSSKN